MVAFSTVLYTSVYERLQILKPYFPIRRTYVVSKGAFQFFKMKNGSRRMIKFIIYSYRQCVQVWKVYMEYSSSISVFYLSNLKKICGKKDKMATACIEVVSEFICIVNKNVNVNQLVLSVYFGKLFIKHVK